MLFSSTATTLLGLEEKFDLYIISTQEGKYLSPKQLHTLIAKGKRFYSRFLPLRKFLGKTESSKDNKPVNQINEPVI